VAAYDPAFSYEVAAIVEDGIVRMTGPEPEDRIWYLTLYNENYPMPPLPTAPDEAERVRIGTIKGMYRLAPESAPDAAGDGPGDGARSGADRRHRATVLFSGSAWQAAAQARRLLAEEWGVDVDLWSVTSYKSLREDAISVERWNRLHPDQTERVPYVTEQLANSAGPVVAVSDFMRAVPDQVSRWMPRPFTSLGTDGYGRSDTREVLRRYFEVDAAHVVVAVLHALAAEGMVPPGAVTDALTRYEVDTTTPDPWAA
jgi:pyruvate dehydrogenase E1 component